MPAKLYFSDEDRIAAARAASQRCYQKTVNARRAAQGLPPLDPGEFGTRRPAYSSAEERREARRLDQQRCRNRARVAAGLPPAVRRNGGTVREGLMAFSIQAAHRRLDAIAAHAAAITQAEKDAATEDLNSGRSINRYGSSKVRMSGTTTLRSAALVLALDDLAPSADPLRCLWSPDRVSDDPLPAGCLIPHGSRQANKNTFTLTFEGMYAGKHAAEARVIAAEEED